MVYLRVQESSQELAQHQDIRLQSSTREYRVREENVHQVAVSGGVSMV